MNVPATLAAPAASLAAPTAPATTASAATAVRTGSGSESNAADRASSGSLPSEIADAKAAAAPPAIERAPCAASPAWARPSAQGWSSSYDRPNAWPTSWTSRHRASPHVGASPASAANPARSSENFWKPPDSVVIAGPMLEAASAAAPKTPFTPALKKSKPAAMLSEPNAWMTLAMPFVTAFFMLDIDVPMPPVAFWACW